MRSVSTGLSTFLDNTTATPPIAHLVTITLRGGTIVRYTDWPSALTVDGLTFEAGGPGSGRPVPVIGDREEVAGTEIGSLTLTLQCGDEAVIGGVRLPLAAMRGTFRGANVKVERLYMSTPGDVSLGTMHLFEGPVGEVRPSSILVELEVESGVAALSTMLPRLVFQPGCSNMLYDSQCLVSQATNTYSGTVGSATSPAGLIFDGSALAAATKATDYFKLGVLTFTAGVNAGESRAIRSDTWSSPNHTLVVDRLLPATPVAGDPFTIYPGCDKLQATCVGKFDNLVHFRGFPYVPRNEAAL
jgi:uncharacterized phage protein (TIGR02218 family)